MLDAAERVVKRDGAAGLTIDALAREAGIGRASVLYDAKTKQVLIEPVIVRAFARDDEWYRRVEPGLETDVDIAIKGRSEVASAIPDPAFKSTALNLRGCLGTAAE